MQNSFPKSPKAINEPVRPYHPGSEDIKAVQQAYKALYNQNTEVPLTLNGEKFKTSNTAEMRPPHDHHHLLGIYHLAGKNEVEKAIESALEARKAWSKLSFQHRATIFLRAADLLAGPYRAKINASTMLAQSKTIHQAEIDAACEFIDFLRFNVQFAEEIYNEQPYSGDGVWNRLSYRPLEGFVYAISPFNFTAIAGNLSAAPALMGNTIVWKPSDHQMLSAHVIMEVFEEAGLPPGVINMVMGDPEMITDTLLASPDFAGIHFTGSTFIFKNIWQKIGQNIHLYKTYPRIVGETGGKDFIIAHPSAAAQEVATGIVRGAFEFQGQKCSAASRVYLPKSKAQAILDRVVSDLKSISMGSPEDTNNFVTAVIHQGAFNRLKEAIEQAKASNEVSILHGGNCDDSKGYFVEPTVLLTTNPHYDTMSRELFGPIVTVYIYEDKSFEDTLKLVDQTSDYALTGAIFSKDRYAAELALEALENSAGNFYINDKPTGAVVGQQPFGGARASGTNDKAGSKLNLLRWVSARLIKEPLLTPSDYRYPFLGE
ncbi:MAG: L-glutamate gamma-semialdehyde dehydrogenase [Flavobacteriaceae bacterium]|nr:L-glutamate gamma-semialdehyde dehydrogenase [Flavobacteriaceae bacterium]